MASNPQNAALEGCRQRLTTYQEVDKERTQLLTVRQIRLCLSPRSFVVVLIDADADDYIFHARFLNKHALGGGEAADELYARIGGYLSILQLNPEDTDIIVRAYANFKSLSKACIAKKKMKNDVSISTVAQGFSQRRSLFDFVDVGSGKDEADNKIRGL
ncbi:MAG: hypothetical protein Q9164_003591 [Protoblastenia rupestris]